MIISVTDIFEKNMKLFVIHFISKKSAHESFFVFFCVFVYLIELKTRRIKIILCSTCGTLQKFEYNTCQFEANCYPFYIKKMHEMTRELFISLRFRLFKLGIAISWILKSRIINIFLGFESQDCHKKIPEIL